MGPTKPYKRTRMPLGSAGHLQSRRCMQRFNLRLRRTGTEVPFVSCIHTQVRKKIKSQEKAFHESTSNLRIRFDPTIPDVLLT